MYVCVFEKERDFYGLFTLGRHACGGQSQLDMAERFLLEMKMGEKGRRGKKKTKLRKVIYRVGERQRPRKKGRERNPVITFIMYSHGEKRIE